VISLSFVFTHKGNFNATRSFLEAMETGKHLNMLDEIGRQGVAALSAATPKDTGETASSWGYKIIRDKYHSQIFWTNSNKNGEFEIAIGLQHGHGTGTGGYVRGRDYINPAMRKVFDDFVRRMWKVVTTS